MEPQTKGLEIGSSGLPQTLDADGFHSDFFCTSDARKALKINYIDNNTAANLKISFSGNKITS